MYEYLTNDEFLGRLTYMLATDCSGFVLIAAEITERFANLLTDIDNLNNILDDKEDSENTCHACGLVYG